MLSCRLGVIIEILSTLVVPKQTVCVLCSCVCILLLFRVRISDSYKNKIEE